jgi:predicted ATPase/DNA-binding CsgD family transcriptional regulator
MQKIYSIFHEDHAIASQDWLSFPVPLTSFVGREQEIKTVCTLLRQPEIRLLTLIGPGGVGKTRLGLQVAASLASELDGQVCLLSLQDTSNPGLVIPAIARELGLQELRSQSILDLLKAYLRKKRLLLLLDNLEQVLDAAPALVHLLEDCPGLKILATSRASLRVSGEQTFCVPPLALPNLAQLPEKEQLLQYSAITLFVERATTVLPAFHLTEENRRLVAEICHHLDGLPLAIELAVPRLRALSLQTLLERLAHRFEVLTQGMRDAPGRHQTLRHNLEWSYRLLNPREQQLFRFLSVFAGGCTLHALETVWELAGHRNGQDVLLDEVASLLEKSMLSRSTQETEEPHLLLLRTIREYGWQLLTLTGELEQVQLAHATYYLALAEEAEPELRGSQPRLWLDRLQREYENVQEALCFLITYGETEASKGTEMALRLGKALGRFWIIGGHAQEGRDLLERALKRSRGASASIRANALCLLTTLDLYQGDFQAARMACQEGLALFRELNDPVGVASSLYRSGSLAWIQRDPETARTHYEESLAIVQGDECKDVCRETLSWFASPAFSQKDTQMASLLIEECLDLSRELGDQSHCASEFTLHPVQATAFSPAEKQPVMGLFPPRSLHEDLTPREQDVLQLVAQGLTDAQVAARLVVSRRTVNFHLTSIYRKLEVSSRSAATRYALEYHLF